MRAAEFFSRARKAFDVPVGFAGPDATPRHDQQDGDPAAIAAVCPVRPAAARCASDRFCFVAARSMQVTKALPPARYVIGLGQVGARRRALITHDRKSVELVLLVLDALRDVVILGYCFGPRVLG